MMIIFFCSGLFAVIAITSRLYLGYKSLSWPSTTGTVIERKEVINVYAGKFRSMNDAPVKHRYSKIKYKYVVNNIEYISSRISFVLVEEENDNNIELNDTAIIVYYMPIYPAIAVIKPGAMQVGLNLIVLSVMLSILTVTWIYINV